jgi:uncharacterized protein YcbX
MRYPVKSLAGESLQEIDVEKYGLYADRGRAFIDPTKEGYDRYFTANHAPAMLKYKAVLTKNKAPGSPFPEVAVTGPEGESLQWDEMLHQRIQSFTDRAIEMTEYDPERDELLGVDSSSVLIITDASLRKAEEIYGSSFSPLRFRHNFVVSLDEDQPFIENDWVGKHLHIGNTVLYVRKKCFRCVKIDMDPQEPESYRKSPSLLKALKETEFYFGVYASVVETGTVFVGDPVYVVAE